MTTWARLADHLGSIPDLNGALCRGQYGRFDIPDPYVAAAAPDVAARLAQAAADCRRCPALTACTRWVDSLRPHQRPAGVVAGRVFVQSPGRAATEERVV